MFEVILHYQRSTKGTHVYANTSDSAPIPNVYIKKTAFEGPAPQRLKGIFTEDI